MPRSDLVLVRVTLAVTKLHAMVHFYGEVFRMHWEARMLGERTLYWGTCAGFELMLCPNELAAVRAEQNRHQFRFQVRDVKAIVEQAIAAGGSLLNEPTNTDDGLVAAVYDPDGNSIEFIQR